MSTEYIHLLSSGNILFQNWSATIYCDERSINTIKVNFGMREDNKNVVGARSPNAEASTIDSIRCTIKFLKKCNREWSAHLNEKRVEFVELNHFKTRQISTLREKLAELVSHPNFEGSSSGVVVVDQELIDLLMSVNKRVDYPMLCSANLKAFESSKKLTADRVAAEVHAEQKRTLAASGSETSSKSSSAALDPEMEKQVVESLLEKGLEE